MEHNFLVAAEWIFLALVASILSIRLGISVALMEIAIGVIGGNTLHIEITPWVNFLAGFGAVILKTEVLRVHPAESIVKYSFEKKADLIVTGTRGMGGFKNLVIGSVAQKVVTYSQVPVTVIK